MATKCANGAATGDATEEIVARALDEAMRRLGDRAAAVGILFASPNHALDRALSTARQILDVEWLVSSSAGEIHDGGVQTGGVTVFLISWDRARHCLSRARPIRCDIPKLATQLCEGYVPLADRALAEGWSNTISVVIGDGLNPEFERLVTEIRRATRIDRDIVGGGAADAERFQRTSVGSHGEVVDGGAVALHVVSEARWGIGIGLGVLSGSERRTITSAKGNVVHTIDDQPAWKIYRDYARGRNETIGDWGQYMVRNQLGIYLFDEIARVRAGVSRQGDSLVFAGGVPEGSIVSIVCAEHDTLIEAARQAAQDARAMVDGEVAGALVFGCITRHLVLGPRGQLEIDAIRSALGDDVPIAGLVSYGEIARVQGKLDGYHNHTVVVAAIPG